MYSSKPHLYYPQNYYLGKFIIAFIRLCLRTASSEKSAAKDRKRSRRQTIVAMIVFFFVLPSLPIWYALFCNYRWDHSQPPRAAVPELVGLDLKTATERARSAHLDTKVLGRTWVTDLSPGLITLQAPDAGQLVPFNTTIGVEFAVTPPPALMPDSKVTQPWATPRGSLGIGSLTCKRRQKWSDSDNSR